MLARSEEKTIIIGGIFQLTMITAFLAALGLYPPDTSPLSPWLWPSHMGLVLFGYCLITLYTKNRRTVRLVTTGVFKYTRHPMYTGFVLMDMIFWLPSPVSVSPLFLGLQTTFFLSLITAARWQEQETLARFGKDAEEYYEKTPRLFILYPWVSR